MGSTWLAVDCLGVAKKAKETATRNRPAWTRRRMGCPFLKPSARLRWGLYRALARSCQAAVVEPSPPAPPPEADRSPVRGRGEYGWPGARAVLDRLNSFGKNGAFYIHTVCILWSHPSEGLSVSRLSVVSLAGVRVSRRGGGRLNTSHVSGISRLSEPGARPLNLGGSFM